MIDEKADYVPWEMCIGADLPDLVRRDESALWPGGCVYVDLGRDWLAFSDGIHVRDGVIRVMSLMGVVCCCVCVDVGDVDGGLHCIVNGIYIE